MKKTIIMLVIFLVFYGTVSLSFAGTNHFQQFNADVDKAYSTYRKVLFQTNKNDAKSMATNRKFIEQWSVVVSSYEQFPPEAFSNDPSWSTTLNSIHDVAMKSIQQIQIGQISEAHETLEAIRDELSDLRKRNSVINFSDHVNNYHAVMEVLLEHGYTQKNIAADNISEINGQYFVLQYLANAIHMNAPETYRKDDAYKKLEKGLFVSLENLKKALEEKDPEAIASTIKKLKPAYAKLFVDFG